MTTTPSITLQPTVSATLPKLNKAGNKPARVETQITLRAKAESGKTSLESLAQKAQIELNQINKTPDQADGIKADIATKVKANITVADLKQAIIKAEAGEKDVDVTNLRIDDSEVPKLFAEALYNAAEVKPADAGKKDPADTGKKDVAGAAKTKVIDDLSKTEPSKLGPGKIVAPLVGIGGAILGLIIGGTGESAGKGIFAAIIAGIGGLGLVAAFPSIAKLFGRNVVHYEVPADEKPPAAAK